MNSNDRITGNFLNAIQKYANKQKQQIENEVHEFKDSEIKAAENESLQEAYELIQKEIAQKRTAIKTQLARKEQESRAELFKLRAEMTKKVFDKAKKLLDDFTQTPEYKAKLIENAGKLAALFKANSSVIYMREADMGLKADIAALFEAPVQIIADSSIKIGGIKGSCPEMNMTADETLDSLLELEYDSFISRSNLKVV